MRQMHYFCQSEVPGTKNTRDIELYQVAPTAVFITIDPVDSCKTP
jgi:hypothetical protein